MRRLATLAALVAIAACGGSGEGGTNPPPPAPVATVTLTQLDATMEIGQTLALGAVAKDAGGLTLSGRSIVWASSDATVASVNGGVVTANAVGNATISATSEGKRGEATVHVKLPAVATVTVDPTSSSVKLTETKQLAVTLQDASGHALTGRVVDWTSSDNAKATVSSTGLVSGVAVGSVTITATSEGKTGSASVLVTSGEPPVINSITPATLAPGVSATITGTNFSPIANEDIVTIAGVPVTVTSASATQLVVAIDPAFPCMSTQAVPVMVTTIGGPVTRQHPLQVATQRSLGLGESLLLGSATESSCNELSQNVGAGRYMVMVYNASTAPSSVASFQLRGNTASPAMSPNKIPLATMRSTGAGTMRLPTGSYEAGVRSHLAMLDGDRDIARRYGLPRPARTARSRALSASRASSAAMMPVPTTVGAITKLRMRNSNSSCSTYDEIDARVAYVGTRSIVLEDTLGPLWKTLDVDYAALGQQFDDVMYPLLTQNFGDPLAADASTDANGRILMLFTPKVNARAEGLLGFVSICDFFPPNFQGTTFAASNLAEIFYARAPLNTNTANPTSDALIYWRENMKSTVMHESKHLAAYAERIASPLEMDTEESWLEEGTAQVASEFYARTVYGPSVAWKSNATYGSTLFCELRRRNAGACFGMPYMMTNHYAWLYNYLIDNERKSFLSPGSVDGTIYGSAWLFARWLTDQYATNEGSFLKAIVLDGTKQGVTNIVDKVGVPFAELNANYLLALALDDYPGFTPPANARYTIASWNVPSIFAGLAADIPTAFHTPPHTVHPMPFGSFAASVLALNGTAAAYFDVSGAQTAKQLLDLRSTSGATLPISSTLRMAIVRLQ